MLSSIDLAVIFWSLLVIPIQYIQYKYNIQYRTYLQADSGGFTAGDKR